MTKIAVINAGNCLLCGREIKIVTNKKSDKFPNIFFCPRCEKQRINKEKGRKEKIEEDANIT